MTNSRNKRKNDLHAFILKNFSTSHMSNAKWMKTFLLLADSHVRRVRCKRVGSDFVLNEPVPQKEQIYTTFLADGAIGGGPLEYDYIEWLELPYHTISRSHRLHPNDQFAIDQFFILLQSKGQFEIVANEGGVRIYGYS